MDQLKHTLAGICAHFLASHNGLLLTQDTSADDCVQALLESVDNNRNQTVVPDSEAFINTNHADYQFTFDLAGLALTELAVVLGDCHRCGHPTKSSNPNAWLVLEICAINLANSANAISLLCRSGLDSQARILMRTFSEVADVTLLALLDDSFLKTLTIPCNGFSEEYRHWKEHFKPTQVASRLCEALVTAGFPQDIASEIRRCKNHNYSWLSYFGHFSLVGCFVTSYPRDPRGFVSPNYVPEPACITVSTLKAATEILVMFLLPATHQIRQLSPNVETEDNERLVLYQHVAFNMFMNLKKNQPSRRKRSRK